MFDKSCEYFSKKKRKDTKFNLQFVSSRTSFSIYECRNKNESLFRLICDNYQLISPLSCLQIIASSHQHINTSSHQHINTSSHQHINISSHQHINTSSHHHVNTSSHQHIITSSHQLIPLIHSPHQFIFQCIKKGMIKLFNNFYCIIGFADT